MHALAVQNSKTNCQVQYRNVIFNKKKLFITLIKKTFHFTINLIKSQYEVSKNANNLLFEIFS